MSLIKSVGLKIKEKFIGWLTKIRHLSGSSKSVAEGLATGVSVSFTPFVGFHLIISMIISKICHQNGVAAAIGTIAGNPFTFPFIWYATYQTGTFMLKQDSKYIQIDFIDLFKKTFNAVIRLDFNTFLGDIWPILYPMIIGCIPFVIISWLTVTLTVERYINKIKEGDGK